MSEYLFTLYDVSNQGLENIPATFLSFDKNTNTLNTNNIDMSDGIISGLQHINGDITSTNSLKVSSSDNLGLTILNQDSFDNVSIDSLMFSFSPVSYGTSSFTPLDQQIVECNNYYFKGLENNAQFFIEITPYNESSFTFNKSNGKFFEYTDEWKQIESGNILFDFSEDSITINKDDKALLSLKKINNHIYFNIKVYYGYTKIEDLV